MYGTVIEALVEYAASAPAEEAGLAVSTVVVASGPPGAASVFPASSLARV